MEPSHSRTYTELPWAKGNKYLVVYAALFWVGWNPSQPKPKESKK
jgi:hypothetical protein